MITDRQVRLLMSLLNQGIALVTAAAKAGMSERSARKYVRAGGAPSTLKVPRTWRTRADPYAEVWPEIEQLLRQDGSLEAKLVWAELLPGPLSTWAAAHSAATISKMACPLGAGSGSLLPPGPCTWRASAVGGAHDPVQFLATVSNWESNYR